MSNVTAVAGGSNTPNTRRRSQEQGKGKSKQPRVGASVGTARPAPKHENNNEGVQLIDTKKGVVSMLDTLCRTRAPCMELYMDLEGVSLSRHGSISLIQIWVHTIRKAYILDIHTLGAEAFNTAKPGKEKESLRKILESSTVTKYFFDVRNDSDALFSHYGIKLDTDTVVDVQLLELATRRGRKERLQGLDACISRAAVLHGDALAKWQDTKQAGQKLFAPVEGGSYEVWNVRPLADTLLKYCVQDVQYLPALAKIYQQRLSPTWALRVQEETSRRLEESWSADYVPNGIHKALGPQAWWKPKTQKDESSVEIAPAKGIKDIKLHITERVPTTESLSQQLGSAANGSLAMTVATGSEVKPGGKRKSKQRAQKRKDKAASMPLATASTTAAATAGPSDTKATVTMLEAPDSEPPPYNAHDEFYLHNTGSDDDEYGGDWSFGSYDRAYSYGQVHEYNYGLREYEW